jgi:hypothetical protein
MNPRTPNPIYPNAEFLVSSVRPHLFENPYFPATGQEVALCQAKGSDLPEFELMKSCQAIDEDTLRVGQDYEYLDNAVGCEECRSSYRIRFKKLPGGREAL